MLDRLATSVGVALLCLSTLADAAFFFQAQGKFPVLEKEISYRNRAADDSDSARVMSASEGWTSQRDKPFSTTGEAVHVWARFSIPPAKEARRVMVLTGPWERAEYFVFRDGQLIDRQRVGTLVPLDERKTNVSMTPASFYAGLVAIDIPPQADLTVLAKLDSENRFIRASRLRFSLWDANWVVGGELRDRLFVGLFLGAMAVLVFYNLTLFLLNAREPSYFYYEVVLVMSTMVQSIMYGLTLEYLWPHHPAWDFLCMWIALPLSLWASAQFVRYYLGTGKYFPRSDILLKWAGYAGLVLLPAYVLAFAAGHPASLYMTLIGTVVVSSILIPLVVGVILVALRERHPLAKVLLVAMLCSGVGAFVTFGSWLDFLPEVEWALNASQIGTVLTGIVLSIGLGLRMRQLQRDLSDKQIEGARLQIEHERERRELIEEQSRGLEAKVQARTSELKASQEKSDELLANILPRAVIDELKATGQSEPRRHEEASILFTDFSGFTQAVSTIPPKRLVQELDDIFRGFDDIIVENGLEKIKTIGDAYMAAGGLPISADNHALRCVRAALALTRFIEKRNSTAAMKWGLRVGVHSGAVVAGIVGKNKFAYDVWGDTVNVASRLESAGETNRVNISAYTFDLVRKHFECEYRGKLAAKGKGEIDMYFVVGECTSDAAE